MQKQRWAKPKAGLTPNSEHLGTKGDRSLVGPPQPRGFDDFTNAACTSCGGPITIRRNGATLERQCDLCHADRFHRATTRPRLAAQAERLRSDADTPATPTPGDFSAALHELLHRRRFGAWLKRTFPDQVWHSELIQALDDLQASFGPGGYGYLRRSFEKLERKNHGSQRRRTPDGLAKLLLSRDQKRALQAMRRHDEERALERAERSGFDLSIKGDTEEKRQASAALRRAFIEFTIADNIQARIALLRTLRQRVANPDVPERVHSLALKNGKLILETKTRGVEQLMSQPVGGRRKPSSPRRPNAPRLKLSPSDRRSQLLEPDRH